MATLPARCRSGAFVGEKWWRVFWASLLWLAFLCSLTARGLSGVELVVSDAHQGLKNAIAVVFAGGSWQRCRTHFMANLLTRVPKRAQPGVATMVRTIYQQLSPAEVHGQLDRVVEQLREPFPQVVELLADAAPDILACTAFPVAHWQRLWSNNPQERLNREIRRRIACPRKGTWWASSPTGCGRGASRATRRMGRSPPLPHHPQRRRQRVTADAQYAGSSGLINTNEDDALLHLLTGHYPAMALLNNGSSRSSSQARIHRRDVAVASRQCMRDTGKPR